MEKIKEVVNNPALLEERLKSFYAKVDKSNKGYITHEELKVALETTAKELNLPKPEREPTEEEKEKGRKIADPDGTGKITFESFRKLALAAIEEGRKRGKI